MTFFTTVLAVGVGVGLAQTRDAEQRPGVSGDWVGTWGVYSPPKDGAPPPSSKYTKEQLRLDARVTELSDGKWEATFEGECGRPYKYTIQMTGRQAGDVVLFQGSADLGEKDGGVYDWIGRATEAEFVGFYTSMKYTGHFRLARPKPASESQKPAAQLKGDAKVPGWVVYPDKEWQALAPEEAGIRDVEAWNNWVKATTKSARGARFQGEDHSGDKWGVAITRGGYLIQTFGDPDYKFQTASLGKCFTMACLQLAIDEGRIKSADELIKDYWIGEGQLNAPHKSLNKDHHNFLTFRHLQTHTGAFPITNGWSWKLGKNYDTPAPKWAKWTGDPDKDNYAHARPGTVGSTYSSAGYWRLAQALTAVWKKDLKQVLDEKIMSHIGIPADRWDWTPGQAVHDKKDWYPKMPGYGDFLDPPSKIDGQPVRGGPGWVVISAKDLARWGLLVATGGEWKGKRLISRIQGHGGGNGSVVDGTGGNVVGAWGQVTSTFDASQIPWKLFTDPPKRKSRVESPPRLESNEKPVPNKKSIEKKEGKEEPFQRPVGIFSVGLRRQPPPKELMEKPFVDGVTIAEGWVYAEPAAGKYDFSTIEKALAAVEPFNKKLTICLFPFPVPDWLNKDPKVQTYKVPHAGPGFTTPVPWDERGLARWEALCKALAEHKVPDRSQGGKLVALRDHSLLFAVHCWPMGMNGIRDIAMMTGRDTPLHATPNYSREALTKGIVRSTHAMVDRFPRQFHCLPFFRIQDKTASPSLDQHLIGALKKEFWSGKGAPQTGLLQENLSAGGPNASGGSVLSQEKSDTYIMLQAIESWAKPTQGFAGAVRQGSPTDAIQRGYDIFDCRYFEIYMNDLLHADYADGFEKWHAFLHGSGPKPTLARAPAGENRERPNPAGRSSRPAPPTNRPGGTLKSVDVEKNTITVTVGEKDQEFSVAAAKLVRPDGAEVAGGLRSLDTFIRRQPVAVTFTTEKKDGQEVITEVHIRPAGRPNDRPALPGSQPAHPDNRQAPSGNESTNPDGQPLKPDDQAATSDYDRERAPSDNVRVAATARSPAETIDSFGDAWDVPSGAMRPPDDEGWKARMVALCELVRLGPESLPALTAAPDDDDAEVRALAAQAIGFLGDASATDTLDRLLADDPDPTVRMYAADALGMIGGMKPKPLYERIAAEDKNKDVRAHVLWALRRDETGLPSKVRKQFEEFVRSAIDTARLGEPGPDFALTDVQGTPHRLSDLRGKKAVVLTFIYGTGTFGLVRQYEAKLPEFEKRGARVFVIDPHDSGRVRHLLAQAGFNPDALPVPVLCDPAHTVSATYGVAFQMRQHTEWSNRPATFLIDRDGVIRYEHRGKNYGDRPRPEELLQELDKLTRGTGACDALCADLACGCAD